MGSYGNSRKRKSDKPVIIVKAKKEKKVEAGATEKKPAAKSATKTTAKTTEKKPTSKKSTKKEA